MSDLELSKPAPLVCNGLEIDEDLASQTDLVMEQCPRFYSCSAPVCPIDGPGPVHLKDEPVCFYLLESVKPNANERFAEHGGGMGRNLYAVMEDIRPALVQDYYPIKKALQRAAKTGSRLKPAASR